VVFLNKDGKGQVVKNPLKIKPVLSWTPAIQLFRNAGTSISYFYVQTDNCWRENRNKYIIIFLCLLFENDLFEKELRQPKRKNATEVSETWDINYSLVCTNLR